MKIKHEQTHKHHSDVTIITTECGRKIYCRGWNGETYRECWEYPNNDDFEPPIDLGRGRYIYDNNIGAVLGFELIV